MSNERMLDGNTRPTRKEVLETIENKAALWSDLREYLAAHYDHEPELGFDGKKYGWAIRYRKGGKTLVTLYPERGSFTTLVVLGKKEITKAEAVLDMLSKNVRTCFENAVAVHDGRWMWIRPLSKADIESVKHLLSAKRRPKSNPGELRTEPV